ncbi:hypothetical protein C8R45DRAFT_922940 [Mycena sanguinolenta]|nr:hypothetical protein C8R45DRAFT_922940 [Mycena sanguinolenta]
MWVRYDGFGIQSVYDVLRREDVGSRRARRRQTVPEAEADGGRGGGGNDARVCGDGMLCFCRPRLFSCSLFSPAPFAFAPARTLPNTLPDTQFHALAHLLFALNRCTEELTKRTAPISRRKFTYGKKRGSGTNSTTEATGVKVRTSGKGNFETQRFYKEFDEAVPVVGHGGMGRNECCEARSQPERTACAPLDVGGRGGKQAERGWHSRSEQLGVTVFRFDGASQLLPNVRLAVIGQRLLDFSAGLPGSRISALPTEWLVANMSVNFEAISEACLLMYIAPMAQDPLNRDTSLCRQDRVTWRYRYRIWYTQLDGLWVVAWGSEVSVPP